MRELDEILGQWTESDYSVRLVRGVCAVVPFAPDVPAYTSVAELLSKRDPKAKKPTLDRAHELARSDGPQKALWVTNAVDTADGGITAFTGVATLVKLVRAESGKRMDALETDTQQAADAVLKGLAIAYLVWSLFPGSPAEKVAAFRALPAGQAMAFYFAVVELGLPFADNALVSGGTLLHDLYGRFVADQKSKLAAVAGPEAADGAGAVMEQLIGPVDAMVKSASGYLGAIAGAVTSYLPTALDTADKAAGMAATAADALPVYRYLGSRVVAEACVARALVEVPPDKPAGNASNPALDGIKYTTKQRDKDDIVVPAAPPAKRGCFLFGVWLLGVIGAGGGIGYGLLG